MTCIHGMPTPANCLDRVHSHLAEVTFSVPTPESLGLTRSSDFCLGWQMKTPNGREFLIYEDHSGRAELTIESYEGGYYGSGTSIHVEARFASLDEALIALSLILGKSEVVR